MPTGCLTVLPVLDLHPGCGVWSVAGPRLLRHDALHVPLADDAEEIRAGGDVIDVKHGVRLTGDQWVIPAGLKTLGRQRLATATALQIPQI